MIDTEAPTRCGFCNAIEGVTSHAGGCQEPTPRIAWIRRLQCAICEAFSFKIVEDGEVWQIECNHCGALVAAAEGQAGKKTHANGAWAKERVLFSKSVLRRLAAMTEPWCPDHGYGCEPQDCPCGHSLRCDCVSIQNDH